MKPQATHAREGTVDAVVALLGRQLLRDRVPRLCLATEVRELRMLSLEGSTRHADLLAGHCSQGGLARLGPHVELGEAPAYALGLGMQGRQQQLLRVLRLEDYACLLDERLRQRGTQRHSGCNQDAIKRQLTTLACSMSGLTTLGAAKGVFNGSSCSACASGGAAASKG